MNVVGFVTGGAISSGACGLVARNMSSSSSMSYGETAGAAIAGFIVAGIISNDIGKASHYPISTNNDYFPQ